MIFAVQSFAQLWCATLDARVWKRIAQLWCAILAGVARLWMREYGNNLRNIGGLRELFAIFESQTFAQLWCATIANVSWLRMRDYGNNLRNIGDSKDSFVIFSVHAFARLWHDLRNYGNKPI